MFRVRPRARAVSVVGREVSMSASELQTLADRVNALPPPERLRLAAGLLEAKRPETAVIIIRAVADELTLALLLARGPKAGGR